MQRLESAGLEFEVFNQNFAEVTVTVMYADGWPATRPIVAGNSPSPVGNVLAIGHSEAPSWLTAADVWFEDVSE